MNALPRIPLPLLYAVGSFVYFTVFHVVRWRRNQVANDIARAFPEMPAVERAEIVRRSYRNLVDVVMEALWGISASADELKQRVAFENPESIERAIVAKQSLVLLAPHFCNWEWLLLAGGARFGMPIDAVVQRQRFAAVDRFLRDVRSRFGGKPIPREDFIYELMSRVGTPRAYALIADQTPPRDAKKHWTRLLNRDTAFFVGAEKVARFLDAPVLYVGMRRVRRGHYAVSLSALATPPYKSEAEGDGPPIMELFARQLETAVEESPADWLWVQKRWKYPKPAESEGAVRRRRP